MIQTERLILRSWREADRTPFAVINADPEVAFWLGGPLDRERSDAAIDRYNEAIQVRGYGRWAVERIEDGALIGSVGIMPVHESYPFHGVEIGWRIARPEWRKGYGGESAQAAIRDGFERIGLDEIVSFTTASNVASRLLLDRVGLVRDPTRDFDHPQLDEQHPLRPHVFYFSRP